MPYAVTHILVPIIIVAIVRDFYLKNKDKKKFPLHYVLIAGVGGVLPDIDIPVSFILNFLGASDWNIHRVFTHSYIFPASLFILFLIFSRFNSNARVCNLTRHNLKLSIIFLMLSFGTLTHLLLDFNFSYLLNIFSEETRSLVPATIDGIFLVIWIIYLELKHKISDFI
ncbi:MAG: metal-dependent hydrolase [Nanoarchaeota archaeon]|nr:metal-dependent hydrolase [Nanoarchaeota archaeon]